MEDIELGNFELTKKFHFYINFQKIGSTTDHNEAEGGSNSSKPDSKTDNDLDEVKEPEEEEDLANEKKLNDELNDKSLTVIFTVHWTHWRNFPSQNTGLAKRIFAVTFAVSTVILR